MRESRRIPRDEQTRKRPAHSRVRNQKSSPVTRVTDTRLVAFTVLLAVSESDAYANLLLPHRISDAHLSAQDAALATELCYGTLRWQGLYDAIIAIVSSRPLSSIDTRALVMLRLGAHQLLAMRTSVHAAVDQTVQLARMKGGESIAKFVNAVLRRISEKSREEWLEEIRGQTQDDNAYLAVVHSHPAWVVRSFRDALVREKAEGELAELLDADNESPAITLAQLPVSASNTLDELESLPGEACRFSPLGTTLVAGGNPATIEQVRRKTARVQDEGSQLAAQVLVHALAPKPGEHWLDLCAAPGGKAAVLASYARQYDCFFTAVELHSARAELVAQALEPLGVGDVVCADGVAYAQAHPAQFDRILLDAPCSGLGSLRRRPESRWRRQPHDIGALTALQERLLTSAMTALKPGGIITYVTCSPHLAETRGIINSVLRKKENIRELSVRPVLDSFTRTPMPSTGAGPSVQLWPHRHRTDAMFISLLTKVE